MSINKNEKNELEKAINELTTQGDNWDISFDDTSHHPHHHFKNRYIPTFNLDADYTTNVPTLVDWIARINFLIRLIKSKINWLILAIKEIFNILDILKARNITSTSTNSIKATKTGEWDTNPIIDLKYDVKISQKPENAITIENDGIYSRDLASVISENGSLITTEYLYNNTDLTNSNGVYSIMIDIDNYDSIKVLFSMGTSMQSMEFNANSLKKAENVEEVTIIGNNITGQEMAMTEYIVEYDKVNKIFKISFSATFVSSILQENYIITKFQDIPQIYLRSFCLIIREVQGQTITQLGS